MTQRTRHCRQCRAADGEHHKMSCSEPGGRNGDGPLRPFRASNDLAAKFARSLRSIATCKSAGTLPFDDAVALEAALWEVAREGDFDDELAALLDDV